MSSGDQVQLTQRPGLVITAVGPDRAGLIFELSSQITSRGGNIEDTKMSKLGGMFALLMLVTGSDAALSEVLSLRPQLEASLGVNCSILPTLAVAQSDQEIWGFSVSSLDRPGIIAKVSDILANHAVNVVSFLSRIENVPLSGTPLFVLEAECTIPQGLDKSIVQATLRAACEREGLDLSDD